MTDSFESNSAFLANDLCRDCGICCDGVLFTYVELSEDEAGALAGKGLDIYRNEKDKPVFNLRCNRFGEQGCTLYQDRPKTCQAYYCDLTRAVMNESISFEDARTQVMDLKQSSAWLLENAPEEIDLMQEGKEEEGEMPEILSLAFLKKANTDTPEANGLRNTLYKALRYFDSKPWPQSFTELEQEFAFRAFEHLKRVDRYFGKTRLLVKYAGLVQKLR